MTEKSRLWGLAESLAALSVLTLAGCTGLLSGSVGGEGKSDSSGTAVGASPGSGSGGAAAASVVPAATDPGRVTMHRLNIAEYDNTMRDLLGITSHPSVDYNFPADDRGSDFDNTADVLTVSPLHISSYNAAATGLVSAAFADPTRRAKLVSCDLGAGGAACARGSLESFVPRAWRREVASTEIDGLMAIVTGATGRGETVQAGLELALRSVLLSPNFLYRPELDPSPTSLTPHPLGAYELASRMSYFLWSSMPDDALFAAAKAGTLQAPDALSTQVARMLADPKAQALVDNFAGQWLFIRLVDGAAPDSTLFPQFDASLRSAFKAETQLLFHEFAFNGMPADQLLTAKFTFANSRLATFYGLPPIASDQMQRVDLSNNPQRGGFLAEGGFLTVVSHADRTSPVKRGKYVLSELLCTDIPAPPPSVNTAIAPDPSGAQSLRKVLEAHLVDPSCAACHGLMDPIGFGLENYDAIGAYRTQDNGQPIDATGTLPSGETFNGLAQLAPLIAKNPAFPKCLATKLYTYALGRGVVLPADEPAHLDSNTLSALGTAFAQGGLKFQDLVAHVVTSPTFLNRRGEGN